MGTPKLIDREIVNKELTGRNHEDILKALALYDAVKKLDVLSKNRRNYWDVTNYSIGVSRASFGSEPTISKDSESSIDAIISLAAEVSNG